MKREDTIGFRVRDLFQAIKRAGPCSRENEICRAPGGETERFTHMHGWIIGYLYEHRDSDVYQRDIEKQFSVRRPTMTAILQLMEKHGLIERVRDENDARLKRITLTPSALAIHELHEREIEALEERMREGIGESELKSFFRTLEKIKANISSPAFASYDDKSSAQGQTNRRN